MGSLVAIPTSIPEEKLNLTTPPGKILFNAFQNYGAYVVGDAAWDVYQISFSSNLYYIHLLLIARYACKRESMSNFKISTISRSEQEIPLLIGIM